MFHNFFWSYSPNDPERNVRESCFKICLKKYFSGIFPVFGSFLNLFFHFFLSLRVLFQNVSADVLKAFKKKIICKFKILESKNPGMDNIHFIFCNFCVRAESKFYLKIATPKTPSLYYLR